MLEVDFASAVPATALGPTVFDSWDLFFFHICAIVLHVLCDVLTSETCHLPQITYGALRHAPCWSYPT